jgi:stage II sporulation protein D
VLATAPQAVAAPATNFTIRGAGYGHGIGLSQYGAYGFAAHGANWQDIVLHYYTGTRLGDAGGKVIRVLLQSGKGTISFTGAVQAGDEKLDPAARYRAVRQGIAQVELQDARGKKIAVSDAPLTISGAPGGIVLLGRAENGLSDGAYRGALELRPGVFGGMMAVNALPLDEYVKGVVPGEVPASWPMPALEAQAVVARSYSLVTDAGGAIFDQYADTRSQMYYGLSRETPGTNAAVSSTSGQVVRYGGNVAVTYYFSTSGGRTENVENVYIGHAPVPYLKSVDDPYDNASPKHRWRVEFTPAQLRRKLGGWVKGKLRGIRVLQRGVSPRIVRAQIVGSRGTTEVTGSELRSRLSLYDSWAYFVTIKSGQDKPPPQDAPPPPTDNGGTLIATSSVFDPLSRLAHARPRRKLVLAGAISPAPRRVTVQQLTAGQWTTLGEGRADRRGRYSMLMPAPGTYRVLAGGAVGPVVRIR